MTYRYLDNIATADVAFEAWGKSERELFITAADAVLNAMVENPDSVIDRVERIISLQAESLEMLLFQLLGEIIFYKDAEQLFLRVRDVRIENDSDNFIIEAAAFGEKINPSRHELNVDVKAVTLHRFSVEKTDIGWKAIVVLDV